MTSADTAEPQFPPPHPTRGRQRLLMLLPLLAGAAVLLVVLLLVPGRRSTSVSLGPSPGSLNRVTDATTSSLDRYWTGELPAAYDQKFTPLRNGFQPKTTHSAAFSCGGDQLTYDDIKGNAFYCPSDDYIAWDAAQLFPRLNTSFGSIAPAIVLAHEMGHAVQRRAGVQAPSLVLELQADCFAGAWVRYAETTRADRVTVESGALDTAVRAVLTLRDQPGSPSENPQAHGLGFDRVNAFQTGYEQGAKSCARFPTGGIVTTELPFRTVEEAQSGGNLAYAAAVPLFTASLDGYWKSSFPQLKPGKAFAAPARRTVARTPLPACPGSTSYDVHAPVAYCAPDNTVVWADDPLSAAHARGGDFVTGTLLSAGWGRAVQAQAGLPQTGRASTLQRDCFTGAWIASLAAGNEQVSLSPGDLDEALATTLASGGASGGDPGAFSRAKALRDGLLEGLGSCR